ncbi:MAG: peptidoglycan-binding protein [Clostridia bacterium]|nr:peptidoglycan-binding protein [Clostridia bacterium]
MLKHYLVGIVLAILAFTTFLTPVSAEELDTGISATATAPIEEKVIKLDDNGFEVVNLQCRLQDLGYYNYKVTGYFGSLTEYAVKLFQKYNNIEQTGKVGSETTEALYSNSAVRMPMDAIDADADRFGNTPSPTPKPTATPKPTPKPTKKPSSSSSSNSNTGGNTVSSNAGKVKTGDYLDWSTVKNIFPKKTVATVIDFDTGVSWKVKRTGGSKHADVEPVSSSDTALYKQALGKYYKNWKRHSCIVLVNGYRIAASYHGYPHGYDAISGNNLTGHYCIHFKNSRTHCSNKIDSDHQACVRRAAGL